MRACEQTAQMLWWLSAVGIMCADLAVRRAGGAMLWHRDVEIDRLPLSWARAENVHGADVYIRPARGRSWPLLFLDDVTPEMTRCVILRYAALAIHTSPEGGCHLWLRIRHCLDESERAEAQRWLARRTGADPASISGEHLGRLAGFKNWKRGGCWVNVAKATSPENRPWDPLRLPPRHDSDPSQDPMPNRRASQKPSGRDTSPSGREWAWTCSMVERGVNPNQILASLIHRAEPRRGHDATRYARVTLHRALQKAAVTRARYRY